MSEINVFINGKEFKATEGDSILNVARGNGVFIPAICYLHGCSPTLACRLCMVEADGKRVYGCNAKVKDGMQILTSTPEIAAERNAIMQTYCINHPLECGVCDQSGECELQNYATLMQVTSQKYAIKDTNKTNIKWGRIGYDPSLCIVCERCITVCKDKIGEAQLKLIPRGGDMPAKELKDTMPKDAYAVWSKFQKSLIGPSNGDTLQCSQCGECASVCPVGALIETDFQYTSNAWELRKIPAANPHSSDCELMYYDVKEQSIEDRRVKIYRTSNEFHFAPLNTAARFGFDWANEKASKDEEKFSQIVQKFKNHEIKNIKFNSFITNEEAFILQLLADKFGISLINDEAMRYQQFLNQYSKFSGESLYNGDVFNLNKTDFIITAGSFLRYDAPNVGYALNNALVINKSAGIYFHTIADDGVKKYSKNLLYVVHKNGFEREILLWILQKFGANLDQNLTQILQNGYQNSKKMVENIVKKEIFEDVIKQITDENGETKEIKESVKKVVDEKVMQEIEIKNSTFALNLGLDEDKVAQILDKKTTFALVIGEDFYYEENALELAALSGMIAKYTNFKVILLPPKTNSLGVAKICKFDTPKEGLVFGYNESGDFTMGVYECDLDAPALTQQEGTFVNYDKRVVPTNAALPYFGYELNDLANALDIRSNLTVDYTSRLGEISEFSNKNFDDLENFYDNFGNSHRGYLLHSLNSNSDETLNLSNLREKTFNIYRANPIHQFSKFTNLASALTEVGALYASKEFLSENLLQENELVWIENDKKSLSISVKLDNNLSGSVAYIGEFDEKLDIEAFFSSRYANLKIRKG